MCTMVVSKARRESVTVGVGSVSGDGLPAHCLALRNARPDESERSQFIFDLMREVRAQFDIF
ncbi:hypothetical protein ABMA10_19400 [Plantibacter sp. RU18]